MSEPSIRATNEWLHEYDVNLQWLQSSLNDFSILYEPAVLAFEATTQTTRFFSQHRIDELLRACSDDLYRYGAYHPIAKEEESGVFSISEPVRASYLVKWIMSFRPLLLDCHLCWQQPAAKKTKPKSKSAIDEAFRKCNEYFANVVSSRVLGMHDLEDDQCVLTDFMVDEQVRDFLYSLRYRMNHQDLYRALFRQLSTGN